MRIAKSLAGLTKGFKPAKFTDVGDYGEWYYNRPEAKRYRGDEKIWINLADMIGKFEPGRVFEFGSGLGNLVKECVKRGIDITGSETSDYAILNNLARDRVIKIGRVPLQNLPFVDNAFDLVVSFEVMEHIGEKDTVPVIRELNRICSGYALLSINTFDPRQPGHINMHPREWWIRVFEQNGFIHDDSRWEEIDGIKHLDWDVYVFKKVNIEEVVKE